MKHETIIICKGKPATQLTPIQADASLDESKRFPLQGRSRPTAVCTTNMS